MIRDIRAIRILSVDDHPVVCENLADSRWTQATRRSIHAEQGDRGVSRSTNRAQAGHAAPLHSCKYRWLHAPDLNPLATPALKSWAEGRQSCPPSTSSTVTVDDRCCVVGASGGRTSTSPASTLS